MSYPETPEEYLIQVIQGSGVDRNWVAQLTIAVQNSGTKGVGALIEQFQHKTQPGFANIRTAFLWAQSWEKGNPPGGSGNGGSPELVREAWLELITKGKYDPAKDIRPKKSKKGSKKVAKKAAAKNEEKEPRKKGRDEPMDSEEAAALGIRGQNSSLDEEQGVESGDYSDIREMMNKGQL